METLKSFAKTLESKIKKAKDEGDIYRVNEIESNIMLGVILEIMIMISVLCLVLNEIGIFTADKLIMRISMAASLVIQVPIAIVNKKHHGDAVWLKSVLEWGLLAVCGIMVSTLGHNVTLVLVIPMLVSIRYCDMRFTRKIALGSLGMLIVSTVLNAYFGIINLNIYHVPAGTVLTVGETLRQAVESAGIDRSAYLKSLIVNDLLAKIMAFSVIGFSCITISKRGRSMTDLQDEITRKSSRIETELNLANEIQTGMLPCIFPAFPDHGELELYATNIPAKEVGGDFYDYFKIDDDLVAIVMADVSGKGIGAALFMTISKIVIKNQLLALKSPAAALTEANRQLCENNEAGLFVTTWAGVYNSAKNELVYTNAGHNPPVVHHREGHCEYLKGTNGLVLAGMEGVIYSESRISLNKGDEIFLYTDGVTEATDRKSQLYGDGRLLACIENHLGETVEDQIRDVLEDINEFVSGAEQFDDITMMGMKIL